MPLVASIPTPASQESYTSCQVESRAEVTPRSLIGLGFRSGSRSHACGRRKHASINYRCATIIVI
jgi:hypothetical protein